MDRPIYYLPPDLKIDGPYWGLEAPWHMQLAEWEPVWARVTGKNIKIAILDTGYKAHNLLPVPILTRSFINGQTIEDGNGHGTHCAGTALGRGGIGAAPGADYIAVKVLSNQGSGGSGGIEAGIRWAADQGADVISMSLGGGGSDAGTNSAIDYAWSKGCYVVAAAGNSEYNGQNTIGWPARYLGCLCTASYAKNGAISNFSSGGREIDWALPGSNIISCGLNNNLVEMSGTSMATPGSAGLLALIKELQLREGYPIWQNADDARSFIKLNCEDSGAPGFDVRFGWGKPLRNKIVEGLVNDTLVWS